MSLRIRQGLTFLVVVFLIALAIILSQYFNIEDLRKFVSKLGIWAPLGVFGLRFTSVVIPSLPGTVYAVLSGGLFGFGPGFLIVSIADLMSCSLSFSLSRRYGRKWVGKFIGDRSMQRVDSLAQKHLEDNFFTMTGLLMTGLFDFVSYGVGLTQTPVSRFLLALVLSVVISNAPFVAVGAGFLEDSGWLLFGALLGVFLLAIVTGWVKKRQRIDVGEGVEDTNSDR